MMDFMETRRVYIELKEQFDQGGLSADQFEKSVTEMTVTDVRGYLWQIGISSGKWYRYDGQGWVQDMPAELSPLSLALTSPEHISRSAATENKRRMNAPERMPHRQAPERISQQSNYPPPIQQVPKQTGKALAWVIGAAISACACFAVISVVVFTALSSRPKIVGQMTILPDGGSFQQQGITITAAHGAVSVPLNLAITQISVTSTPDEGVLAQAAPIQILGPLDQMHGSLHVTLPIPPEWLAPGGALPAGETVVIVEEGEAFGTSVGVILDQRPLPTLIDLQTHTATVEVVFSSSGIASHSSARLASPMRRDDHALTYRMLKIREKQFECYNQDFNIWAGFVPLSEENCQKLLDILSDSKKKLEDLGFTDALNQHNRPIQIYLGSTGPNYGQATIGSFSSVNNSYIELDKKQLDKGKDMDLSDPNKTQFIKSIIGHEIFHLVQYIYNPILIKAMFPGMATEQEHLKTIWSDEAMSVWFEPIAVNDQSFVPLLEATFLGNTITKGFLNEPLAVPVIGEDDNGNKSFPIGERHKGYGSALFLHFLTNYYGNELIREVLERQLFVSSDQPIALVAWDQALIARESSLSDEYKYFLEGFLIRGETIHPNVFVNSLQRVEDISARYPLETVFVDVKLDEEKAEDREGAWYALFKDRHQILIKSSERGYIKAGSSPARTSIQIPLQNFQFKTVRLIINPSDIINIYPATLGVQIGCSGGSVSQACPDSVSLLAYPIPKGHEFTLPSYDGALSNSDSYIIPGGDNSFLWNSDQFATGGPYQGLFFIAFNTRLSASNDPTNVTIDLAYIWDKQLEEPIAPIEEPIPPTETPVPPTETPTPAVDEPAPQTDEMSPEEACACVDQYFSNVNFANSLQYYKETSGDYFVSFEIVQQIPFTYNSSTGACEGHYAHQLCANYPENPNLCQIIWNDWGNNPGYLNKEYPVDGPYYCSLLP